MGTHRRHRTLDQRKEHRARLLKHRGSSPDQPGEMLDLYLGGESAAEIARAYGIRTCTVYNSISKEALYRLMTQQAAERLEEMDGIGKSLK